MRWDCTPTSVARFDKADMVDSAIAAFEQYIETSQLDRLRYDAIYMPHILQRLGALYEEKGNRPKAIGYYKRFVGLWRTADPELQPRVTAARKRIESLRPPRRWVLVVAT
jgi:DNA-binding SARP family transcriptional activator